VAFPLLFRRRNKGKTIDAAAVAPKEGSSIDHEKEVIDEQTPPIYHGPTYEIYTDNVPSELPATGDQSPVELETTNRLR
jgi:hypothetical protein